MTADQTPPNDTRAPVWPQGGYAPGSYWCKCVSCDQQFTGDKRAYQCPDCVIQALASLFGAREAAAYRQGLHDGITKAANRYWVGSQPDSWDYFRVAHNAMLDLKSFEYPAPDGQAALDRLIAERVREAAEAEREACASIVREEERRAKWDAQHRGHDTATRAKASAAWSSLGVAAQMIEERARASKEGRDG